mmetsp:Transcript_3244/g.6612  ORF Transcript_3244/g.6612 Transcript_3244/m.6612 type:complete len:87 (+) Transcript_3244:690-950(+)
MALYVQERQDKSTTLRRKYLMMASAAQVQLIWEASCVDQLQWMWRIMPSVSPNCWWVHIVVRTQDKTVNCPVKTEWLSVGILDWNE